MSSERASSPPPPGGAQFETTHWTVVLAAGHDSSPDARAALEQLCRIYWYPLYAYLRRKGYSPPDAQDLTQSFFVSLLERNSLRSVERGKGRFRSFLLASLNYFLADERAKVRAQKRGGGRAPIELDALAAEDRYRLEPVTEPSPDRIFDRRWALTILENALRRLEGEFASADKAPLLARLRGFLLEEGGNEAYAEAGRALSMTEGAVKTAVHRLRRRYRQLCREEVAQTVGAPGEIDEELRYLCEVISG